MTTPNTPRLPKLRRHSDGGAFVEIDRRRRHLGARYGTPEAQQRYDQLVAEWLSHGRQLPRDSNKRLGLGNQCPDDRLTVINLLAAYLRHATQHYGLTPALEDVKYAMRPLKRLYGYTPVNDFGPKKLAVLRDDVVRAGNWNRDTINQRISRIKAIFKWGVSQEIVDPNVWKSLDAVENLKAGRSAAREPKKVRAVPMEVVEATLPVLSPPVAGLVRLQLLTAARGGELFGLRPLDLDMSGDVWKYIPEKHKGKWRGKSRTIAIGPAGQEVLKPLLVGCAVDQPVFRPTDAGPDAAKRTTEDRYNKNTYGRAIARACAKAFSPPPELLRQRVPAEGRKNERWETPREVRARIGPEGQQKLKAWRTDHKWSPHQLRHLALTLIERSHGLEAARLVAGHSAASLTKSVYVEEDERRILSVMKEVG